MASPDQALRSLQRAAKVVPRRFRCSVCKDLIEQEQRGKVLTDRCFSCELRELKPLLPKKRKKTPKQQAHARRRARIERLLKRQKYRCAICGARFTKKYPPCIDHCHELGHDRGLLCSPCNLGLGHFRDDPARLRQAANYLEANAEDRED